MSVHAFELQTSPGVVALKAAKRLRLWVEGRVEGVLQARCAASSSTHPTTGGQCRATVNTVKSGCSEEAYEGTRVELVLSRCTN